jgi:hypothetical protein
MRYEGIVEFETFIGLVLGVDSMLKSGEDRKSMVYLSTKINKLYLFVYLQVMTGRIFFHLDLSLTS